MPDTSATGTAAAISLSRFSRTWTPASGTRRQTGIAHMPRYLIWAVESLAGHMERGKDAAFNCALHFGLARLRKFPGIAEIQRMRGELVRHGDPEIMSFFEQFGVLDVDTGGAGSRERRYKRHVEEVLAESRGSIAVDLGLAASQFDILALVAAFVDAPTFVSKPIYREAMKRTLVRFGERLAARATRASELQATLMGDPTASIGTSFDDVVQHLWKGVPTGLPDMPEWLRAALQGKLQTPFMDLVYIANQYAVSRSALAQLLKDLESTGQVSHLKHGHYALPGVH